MIETVNDPTPGIEEEIRRFQLLQNKLGPLFEKVFPNPDQIRSVVVVPSLTLHPEELGKISGVQCYEERLLVLLMLLRLPRTHLIYLTSQSLNPTIIEYYLHLLPGIPSDHARTRLRLFCCHDGSNISLTQKILNRPRLVRRIRDAIHDTESAHMVCFNATPLERTLAVRLDIPLYGCDPGLNDLGTKSGSRKIFKEADVLYPDGMEDLHHESDIVEALTELKAKEPALRRAVVKLNDGFSGEGNAVFPFEGSPSGSGLKGWIKRELNRRLAFEAPGETWPRFRTKFEAMGGVVECFIEGEHKRSPSVQARVDPLGIPTVISTHDQVLGGASGQIFLGCTFPANEEYRLEIQRSGQKIAQMLKDRHVLGRFAIDFVSVREDGHWKHYAIEINLRKGGTTHPFMMLQFLTDGDYDEATGMFLTPSGHPRYYYATDNLQNPAYKGLLPEDLIDIAVYHRLHFHGATQEGVVFHLIGALSEFGKIGVTSVASSPEHACKLYEDCVGILNLETQGQGRAERAPYGARREIDGG